MPAECLPVADSKHQMLTLTSIMLPSDGERQDEFFEKTGLNAWEFRTQSWADVTQISVPDLSPKERRFIDEMLFAEPMDQLHARLLFKLHKQNQLSLEHLQQYLTHYRRYPNFVYSGG